MGKCVARKSDAGSWEPSRTRSRKDLSRPGRCQPFGGGPFGSRNASWMGVIWRLDASCYNSPSWPTWKLAGCGLNGWTDHLLHLWDCYLSRSETERREERVVKNFLSFWKVKRGTWNVVLFLFFLKETLFVELSKVTHVSGIKNASRGIFCK